MGKPIRVLHALAGLNRGGIETWLVNVLHRIDREKYHFDFLVQTDRKCLTTMKYYLWVAKSSRAYLLIVPGYTRKDSNMRLNNMALMMYFIVTTTCFLDSTYFWPKEATYLCG